MMVAIKLIVGFLVCFGMAQWAMEVPVVHQAATLSVSENPQPQLQLTTSIASQRYQVEYGTRMLHWTLKLTYTNTGNEPVLLDKKSALIYRSMVSRNLKAAVRKKYVEEVTSWFISVENMRAAGYRDEDPEEAAFLILNPGGSFSVETDLRKRPYDKAKAPDGLRQGNYFLELRVATWYYYIDPTPYAEKWRSKGHLQFKDMTSQPMPFTIE